MTARANVCDCKTCVGTPCTCGCQNVATAPTAACNCGDTCNCDGCKHAGARVSETR